MLLTGVQRHLPVAFYERRRLRKGKEENIGPEKEQERVTAG